MTGRLVGVGVGPGDPDLVTVKAVRVLQSADLVVVPVQSVDGEGRAERTVRAHITHDRVRRVVFALSERGGVTDARRRAWQAAADLVVGAFDDGAGTVAFATIGDPNVYSTFTYLAAAVRADRPGLTVSTVPGITAMQALAAASGVPLCEGRELLTLVPMTAGPEVLESALDSGGSVVVYKGGRHTGSLLEALQRHGRRAVAGADLGLPGERVLPDLTRGDGTLPDAAGADPAGTAAELPYLSTVLVPARRETVGGKL